MKITQFIYLTALFSLGIEPFLPNSALANNNKKSNFINNNSSSLISKKIIIRESIDWQNLQERDNYLLEQKKSLFQIARQPRRRGQASWYGGKFHGRPTASGEIFNSNALTAAHPSLPFGTKVKVTNTNNGRSVIVRINDRGPFVKGRIIDVSAAAARRLNMINSGTATVQLEIL